MRPDLDTKITGDTLAAAEYNDGPAEMKVPMIDAGIALATGDLTMLARGISQYAGAAAFFNTGGTAQDITLAAVGTMKVPEQLAKGLMVRWRPGEDCPGGAITLKLGSALDAKSLTDGAGANLAANAYLSSQDVFARFDAVADKWFLLPLTELTNGENLLDGGDFIHWSHLAEPDLGNAGEITAACTVKRGGTTDYDLPFDRWHAIAGDTVTAAVDDVFTFRRATGSNGLGPLGVSGLDAGMRAAAVLEVVITGDKGGLIQNIENTRVAAILNEDAVVKCSLQFKVKQEAVGSFDDMRAAVISWTGTTDDLPATPISDWNADGVTPTLVASNIFENTPVVLGTLTDAFQLFCIPDIDVSTANVNNLRVLIWFNDASNTLAGDQLWITEVKLEPQAICTPFVKKSPDEEEKAARRHYQLLGQQDQSGATDDARVTVGWAAYSNGASTHLMVTCPLSPPMPRKPDQADVNGGASADFSLKSQDGTGTAYVNVTGVSETEGDHQNGKDYVSVRVTAAPSAAEASYALVVGSAADADLFFDAGIMVRSNL